MQSLTEHLLTSPVQVVLAWTAIVLLAILLFLREPGTVTLASDEAGRLEISRHALHRLIEACCEQLKGVASARAVVSKSRGKLKTEIRLKVRPNAKLDAIRGYLSQEVVEIYRQNLGIENVGPVEVKVVGVVAEPSGF